MFPKSSALPGLDAVDAAVWADVAALAADAAALQAQLRERGKVGQTPRLSAQVRQGGLPHQHGQLMPHHLPPGLGQGDLRARGGQLLPLLVHIQRGGKAGAEPEQGQLQKRPARLLLLPKQLPYSFKP